MRQNPRKASLTTQDLWPLQVSTVTSDLANTRRDATAQSQNHPNEVDLSVLRDPPSTSSTNLACSSTSANPERDHCISDHHDPDGVSAILGAITGEQQNQGFHGASSAANFMQQIRQAIDAQIGVSPESVHDGPQNDQTSTYTGDGLYPSSNIAIKQKVNNYVLPPRKLADSLLQTYWIYVYPLYPFLDRTNFTSMYNGIWTGDWASMASSSRTFVMSDDEPTGVCIFNMVLALSCQYSDTLEEGSHRATAKIFFLRAKESLQFDPINVSNRSIHLVQALLLSGQYLQSIGSPHEAWGAIGAAMRICHELGFHLSSATGERAAQSVREGETVKRVYHGCIMMDRQVFN